MINWEQHLQQVHPEGYWNAQDEFVYQHGKLIPTRGRVSLQREYIEGGIPLELKQVFNASVAHLDHRGLVK